MTLRIPLLKPLSHLREMLRAATLTAGLTTAALLPAPAAAYLMNIDFQGSTPTVYADVSGILPPGPTLSGRITLDYDTVPDINDGAVARYPGGIVGGYWSSGASSWSFVDGPENRFYVLNDDPGVRGSPAVDSFQTHANFIGSDFNGFEPNDFSISLFGYGAGNSPLASTAPPTVIDLDAFAAAAGGGQLILAFLSGPNQNVYVNYSLDSLTLTPVAAEVGEPATLALAALGLLAAAAGRRRLRAPRR